MKKMLSILFIFILVFACTACQEKMEEPFIYSAKTALVTNTDGWVTFFTHEAYSDDNYYMYNAYNLKYKRIEGYEVDVLDSETGDIVDKTYPSLPSYNCKSSAADAEIRRISAYFEEKNHQSQITLEDLNDLELEEIDKNKVVELFNKMIKTSPLPDGRYLNLPEADIVQEWETTSFTDGWQVGYYISHGVIMAVHIEFLKEGNYISDGGSEFGEDAALIYAEIQKVENQILDEGTFAVTFDESQYPSISFANLKKLLQRIDSNGQK